MKFLECNFLLPLKLMATLEIIQFHKYYITRGMSTSTYLYKILAVNFSKV